MMPGWLLAGLLATFGADATTTSIELARGETREVVLPTQRPAVVTAIIAGEAGAAIWVDHRLRQQGHPRLATSVSIITMVIRGSAVTFNLTQLRKAERAR